MQIHKDTNINALIPSNVSSFNFSFNKLIHTCYEKVTWLTLTLNSKPNLEWMLLQLRLQAKVICLRLTAEKANG